MGEHSVKHHRERVQGEIIGFMKSGLGEYIITSIKDSPLPPVYFSLGDYAEYAAMYARFHASFAGILVSHHTLINGKQLSSYTDIFEGEYDPWLFVKTINEAQESIFSLPPTSDNEADNHYRRLKVVTLTPETVRVRSKKNVSDVEFNSWKPLFDEEKKLWTPVGDEESPEGYTPIIRLD